MSCIVSLVLISGCDIHVHAGGSTPRDLIQRVQNLERRLLQLESYSPEYVQSQVSACVTQRWSIDLVFRRPPTTVGISFSLVSLCRVTCYPDLSTHNVTFLKHYNIHVSTKHTLQFYAHTSTWLKILNLYCCKYIAVIVIYEAPVHYTTSQDWSNTSSNWCRKNSESWETVIVLHCCLSIMPFVSMTISLPLGHIEIRTKFPGSCRQ